MKKICLLLVALMSLFGCTAYAVTDVDFNVPDVIRKKFDEKNVLLLGDSISCCMSKPFKEALIGLGKDMKLYGIPGASFTYTGGTPNMIINQIENVIRTEGNLGKYDLVVINPELMIGISLLNYSLQQLLTHSMD